MSILPAVGEASYNDVVFDVLHRSHVTGKVELDESRRVVKWVQWTIDIDAWIGGSVDTGTELEEKRIKLTEIAGPLRFFDKGFGELIVNDSSTSDVLDVNWGPIPELLSWRPLGGAMGCMISWRVTTCIPECADAKYEGLVAFNYTEEWDVDKDAYQTRTIAGHVEIAQTRYEGNPRRVFESADKWRERIRPPVPLGFQRTTPGHFSLSMNRNRLDFRFVDTQIPRPLPGNATGVEATQRVTRGSAKGKPNFLMWNIELNGTITLPPDAPKSDAWKVFLIILNSRTRGIGGAFLKDGALFERIGFTKNGAAYLHSIQWEEAIFGRTSSFAVRYEYIGVTLKEILEASNLWSFIGVERGNAAWITYKNANDRATWGTRGAAGLKHLDGEEILVDLCLPEPSTLKGKLPPSVPSELKPGKNPPVGKPGDPKPEFTWRYYVNYLKIVEDNGVVQHRRLPLDNELKTGDQSTTLSSGVDPTKNNAMLFAKQVSAPAIPDPPAKQPLIVQQVRNPIYYIHMFGESERIGEDIPAPRLVSVGGVKVTQVWGEVTKGVIGFMGGRPLNYCGWRFVYMLPEKFVGPAPDLANPSFLLPGG